MTKTDEGADYEVGYGKPPKNTQFKKGTSGNPKGRPKGAKGIRAKIEAELNSKVKVREGGREVSMTKAEATAKQFVNKAMKGDSQALRILFSLEPPEQDPVVAIQAGEPTENTDSGNLEMLRYFADMVRSGYSVGPEKEAAVEEGGDTQDNDDSTATVTLAEDDQ